MHVSDDREDRGDRDDQADQSSSDRFRLDLGTSDHDDGDQDDHDDPENPVLLTWRGVQTGTRDNDTRLDVLRIGTLGSDVGKNAIERVGSLSGQPRFQRTSNGARRGIGSSKGTLAERQRPEGKRKSTGHNHTMEMMRVSEQSEEDRGWETKSPRQQKQEKKGEMIVLISDRWSNANVRSLLLIDLASMSDF